MRDNLIINCPVYLSRYVSLVDEPSLPLPAAAAALPPPVPEKKSNWFRRAKSKDEKHKVHKSDSLSKEAESPENNTTASSPSDGGVSGSKLSLTDRDKIREQIKKLGIDFFSEDFEGTTMSSTKCLTCETVTEQKETMIDLAVPITTNMDIDQSNLIQVCSRRKSFIFSHRLSQFESNLVHRTCA